MDTETLAALAGIGFSLAFSYVPGLKAKFAAQSTESKRLIMAGVLAVVSAGVYGASCANLGSSLLAANVTCDQAGR